jgi:Zn-dependent protease
MRHNISSITEIRDIIIADLVLIVAFSLILGRYGIHGFLSGFIAALPISALGVTLSFVLHELMHKFVAQRYGAIAEFRSSRIGLLITLASGAFGFLIGIPGATYIFSHSFTKRQNGIVSLAGPAANLAIFALFLAAGQFFTGTYAATAIQFVIFISIWLAFFNMLPIFPFDGSKVLSWSLPVYASMMGLILVLMLAFVPIIPISYLIFVIIIALAFSMFYRVLI